MEKITRSEAEWREQLNPEEFRITRQAGTERAFTGKYDKHYKDGIYRCAGCGNPLFDSETKFDSGTGWPSFVRPIAPQAMVEKADYKLILPRTEVRSRLADSHPTTQPVSPHPPCPAGLSA